MPLLRRSGPRYPVAAKVPQITALFWVIKLLTTGMGEAAADGLAKVNIGLAALVGLVGFTVAMRWQLRARAYRAEVYWFAVSMVAVFGTMGADALHILFRVPYAASTITCLIAMGVVFRWWYRSERTLSIHSITTRRRELFYWAAVLATFAMGTAIGDLTATTLRLGFAGSTALFAVLILIPAVGWWRLGWNPVASFWAAYILTRPLGASIADWLGKPHSFGHGLGFGDGRVAVVSTLLIAILVTYSARRRHGLQPLPERDTPRLLYHHLSRAELDESLRAGALQPAPLQWQGSAIRNLPPVILLSDDPNVDHSPSSTRNAARAHNQPAVRMTVAVADAARWNDWAHIYRLPRAMRRHNREPWPRNAHWISTTPIPMHAWAKITDTTDGTQLWPRPTFGPADG